jgi:hypothetical protein
MWHRLRGLFGGVMAPDPLARPPGLDGDPGLGIPGLGGIPRPQEGDAAVTADAPGIPGDEVRFVTLGDGTLIAPAEVPDGVLFPLATAIEELVDPPYEAVARRVLDDLWGVSGTEAETLDVDAGSPGQELTFSRVGGVEEVTIDGGSSSLPVPFRAFLAGDDDMVIEARRADETTWVLHRSLL